MAKSYEDAKNQQYKYWKNKPVMKLGDKNYVSEQIKTNPELNKFKKDKYTDLPSGYQWDKVELGDEQKMNTVADFLSNKYCRGTESTYVIKYDPERLRWEMGNVGFFLTVNDAKNIIIGLIGFTYRTVQIYSNRMTMTEPIYMCCDKQYRGKGLAKVLMDETIRQSLTRGIDKGIFCNNRIIPKPIATIRQYSRPLNYKKLRENEFVEITGVNDDIVHNKTRINLYPNKKYIVAEKSEENINTVYELYKKYMESFNLHMVMSKHEIANYMFDSRYVKTIFVMDDKNKPIDFITYNFYDIVNTEKTENNIIKTANLLVYSSNETRSDLLFVNILKQLSADKIQIVYVNDMMHSNEFILSTIKNADQDTDDEEENAAYDLNIIKTGKKYFINLFNWKCESLRQDMVSWLIF
jgi:GNAT superfamily N-acetyltransferase